MQAGDRIAVVKGKKCRRHLVVDDSKTNRDILAAYLQGRGLAVDCVATGAEALKRVAELGNDGYDVVWTDLNMAGMTGEELAKKLRETGYQNYLAVLTGNISAEQSARCKEIGVDLICLKPLRKKNLLEFPIMRIYEE
jgi:CheY-like chemotaxis protein